ncbi:hypothetical protein L2E82_25483 [Cichorium intybus]|uniref:Uncharacterized protein n=1 Tax=Cichorium intybus TaxID=13427 RepID=A0ACB9E4Q7_CICIN|nr:hypothetical protein L2E82_25483 [Cichorium intybus]
MSRILVAIRQNIQNMRKSPKVADENMSGEGHGAELANLAQHTRHGLPNGLSLIYSIVRAPLSLLSCLSCHSHMNGATDGAWVSGELSRISEVNHLIVNDSMRYAILIHWSSASFLDSNLAESKGDSHSQ